MLTTDFDYDLPEARIAKFPPKVRGQAKLLVVNRKSGSLEHRRYADMVDYFSAGDVLVLNETRVEQQRVRFQPDPDKPGKPFNSGALSSKKVELLFLHPVSKEASEWYVRVGNAKEALKQELLTSADGNNALELRREGEEYIARFTKGSALDLFGSQGETPIPPYLNREATDLDRKRYNSVFAKNSGSAAAPTASLNMTPELLARIEAKGVELARVNLEIGWGTFAPVRSENMEEHKIHSERYWVDERAAATIQAAKERGGKIWALGTTAARTLETIGQLAQESGGEVTASHGDTDIFIYPSYEWQLVDGLITNFHAPKSSLIAMVSALASLEIIKKAYQEALTHNYNFLSYGDSMLIRPD